MARILRAAAGTLATLFVATLASAGQAGGASASQPALDFDYFKTRVQPIFTTKRAGNARCVSCHDSGTPMRLQKLPSGSATWSEEDSRKNFELVKSRVIPGNPDISKLLKHPLAESAGGDPHDSERDPGHFVHVLDDGTVMGGPKLAALPATRRDYDTALRVSGDLDFGQVWINCHLIQPAELPNGGYKQSGHGNDLSLLALDDYTRVKQVTSALSRR